MSIGIYFDFDNSNIIFTLNFARTQKQKTHIITLFSCNFHVVDNF